MNSSDNFSVSNAFDRDENSISKEPFKPLVEENHPLGLHRSPLESVYQDPLSRQLEELEPTQLRENEFIPREPETNPIQIDRLDFEKPHIVNQEAVDLRSPVKIDSKTVLGKTISFANELLNNFLQDPNFDRKLEKAFGEEINFKDAFFLIKDLTDGIGMPEIKVMPIAQLNARGAFDGKQIYIAEELFNTKTSDFTEAANVLLEELGHYLDKHLHKTDSPGDEGAIFAALVQNHPLDSAKLEALKAEQDSATLNIDGQKIVVEQESLDVLPPIFKIETALARDTGKSNRDRYTYNPNVTGKVKGDGEVVKFVAGIDDKPLEFDILDSLVNGNFNLDRDRLEEINQGLLIDGKHTLKLQATDGEGNISNLVEFEFTLDTQRPIASSQLAIQGETDTVTQNNSPTIIGTAETGTTVQLFTQKNELLGMNVAIDGKWQIPTDKLTDGIQNFKLVAVDNAGNPSEVKPFAVTVDTITPELTISSPLANSKLSPGDKLKGSVSGKGLDLTQLIYSFDRATEIIIPTSAVDANGNFETEIDLSGLKTGEHTLFVKAIDTAGNTFETVGITVTVTQP
jgi:Bacterial Ig-like domain